MDEKRATKKRRKLRKRNIFLLALLLVFVFALGIGGYAYWQYHAAYKASVADAGVKNKPDIEFNGVEDKFGNINVLMMGVDSRGEKQSRSDSIMIAQYNQDTKTPKIVSVMRDSYVNIPGHGMNKINAAEAIGGPELMRKTIKENFDVDIQYYAQIDFKGFTKMVDKAFPDGIEVDVEKEMSKNIGVTLSPGQQTLHGKELLGYVRFRHDAESDFGRVKRQQKVLKIVADNIVSFTGITHLPQMVGTIEPYIDTNVKKSLVLSVATSFIKDDNKIASLRIPVKDGFQETRAMIGNDNASILQIDLEKNRAALKDFLSDATTSKDADDVEGEQTANDDVQEIANVQEAVEHLKAEFDKTGEVNLDDTTFIPQQDAAETDEKGSYYTIGLESKSMKENGGSGTVGKYKVYEDGQYESAN